MKRIVTFLTVVVVMVAFTFAQEKPQVQGEPVKKTCCKKNIAENFCSAEKETKQRCKKNQKYHRKNEKALHAEQSTKKFCCKKEAEKKSCSTTKNDNSGA